MCVNISLGIGAYSGRRDTSRWIRRTLSKRTLTTRIIIYPPLSHCLRYVRHTGPCRRPRRDVIWALALLSNGLGDEAKLEECSRLFAVYSGLARYEIRQWCGKSIVTLDCIAYVDYTAWERHLRD